MKTRALKLLKTRWQKRLGLADWKIEIEFRPEEDMKDAAGLTSWLAEHKQAQIWIAAPEEFKQLRGQTIESVTVHELLHILLEGHEDIEKSKRSVGFERALNQLADALLAPHKKTK